jgi:hypothetical protein
VGSIEKDSSELQAEHKSLFETANAKELAKKVRLAFFPWFLMFLLSNIREDSCVLY